MSMIQTLCPYAVLPLTSGESNDEHILPFALGAPARFTVRALAEENSRMNELIDAPTVNDSMLRFIAMTQGVSSRSGPVKASVAGAVQGSNEAVVGTFSQNGLDLKFTKPIETDADGRVIGVRGFGADAQKRASQVASNYAKKGIPIELGLQKTIEHPELGFGLSADLSMIRRQLYKIAYLTTVRIFGDQAITGRSGEQFRAAIMAETDQALALTELGGGAYIELPHTVARSSGPHEHAITCVLVPDEGVMTAVHLFGSFSLLVVSSRQGIVAPELTGEVIRIAAKKATLTRRSYLESVDELMPEMNFRG